MVTAQLLLVCRAQCHPAALQGTPLALLRAHSATASVRGFRETESKVI